jgi:ABC-2 type transport system permease protein
MSAYEQWIAFLTIMRKEVRRYLRIWTQTLLPSAITMSLYFLIFGTLIGKANRDHGRRELHGICRSWVDHDGHHY